MNDSGYPPHAWVMTLLSSWVAGTLAQVSVWLAGGPVEPAVILALLAFHQQVSIPVALWAVIPLCLEASFIRRNKVRKWVLPATAVLTFTISVGYFIIRSLPGVNEGGQWYTTLPRDVVSLLAFHSIPWFVVETATRMKGATSQGGLSEEDPQ